MGVHRGDAHREFVLVASTTLLVLVSSDGGDSLASQRGVDNTDWCFEVVDAGFAPVAALHYAKKQMKVLMNNNCEL
jgi:hypothetical protein